MSFFVNINEIKLSIIEETKKLNECILKYYNEAFPPEDLKDFKHCCDEDELNLLIECYNIFSEKNKLQSLDKDFIKALIAYYYIIQVLEYYVPQYMDEKYLKIDNEKPSIWSPDKTIFKDSSGREFVETKNKNDNNKDFIEVEYIKNKRKFYVSNKDRKNNPYFYSDKEGKNKTILPDYMDCFEKLLTTVKSKEYFDKFSLGDEGWVSPIRRLILNLDGGRKKKYKKIVKKNKKTIKKRVKKNKKTKKYHKSKRNHK